MGEVRPKHRTRSRPDPALPLIVGLLAAAQTAATAAPPVVTLGARQVLASLNAAWTARGEPPFAATGERSAPGSIACSARRLCVAFMGAPDRSAAVKLTGPVGMREDSQRYVQAQVLLVTIVAPGAPFRPAVTADRLAVGDSLPADAQLGPTCMHVEVSDGAMSTTISHRRCLAG